MADLTLKQYNLEPALVANLTANGQPIPGLDSATSITVTLKGKLGGVVTGVCTLTDIDSAEVTYLWEDGDTSVADTYEAEWTIEWPNGRPQTVPNEAANNPTVEIDATLNGQAG